MFDIPGAVAFYHTECCDAHWELVSLTGGVLRLYCAECGKPGNTIRVVDDDV